MQAVQRSVCVFSSCKLGYLTLQLSEQLLHCLHIIVQPSQLAEVSQETYQIAPAVFPQPSYDLVITSIHRIDPRKWMQCLDHEMQAVLVLPARRGLWLVNRSVLFPAVCACVTFSPKCPALLVQVHRTNLCLARNGDSHRHLPWSSESAVRKTCHLHMTRVHSQTPLS